MKSPLASIVALALAVSSALAQLTVNTPTSVVACLPALINWSGGIPPYDLSTFSILPGNQPTAAALVTFPATNATSLTWFVTIPEGTTLGLDLRDSTGALAQSAPFTVQNGPESNCTSSSSVSFGSTAAAGSTPTTAQGSSATGTSPLTTSANPISGTSTTGAGITATSTGTSTGTSSSSTTSKSAGASRATGQVAAAGIIGAAIVALLG